MKRTLEAPCYHRRLSGEDEHERAEDESDTRVGEQVSESNQRRQDSSRLPDDRRDHEAGDESQPEGVGDEHRRFRYTPDQYAGGREADWMRVAFAPRKGKVTLYISSGFEGYRELRAKLGKTTGGKGCIHIRRLSDIDLPTLRKLVGDSVRNLDKR